MRGRYLIFVVASLAALVPTVPAQQLTAEEELVVAYRNLGASSMTQELHEVELLRWSAIAELVAANLSTERRDFLERLQDHLTVAAGVWDRDPDSVAGLEQARADLAGLTGAPLSDAAADDLWQRVLDHTVEHAVEDAYHVFANRSSTQEGIEALDIGVRMAEETGRPPDGRLTAFLEAERARLETDLRLARQDARQASLLEDRYPQPLHPFHLAHLHRATKLRQDAMVLYDRHGEREDVEHVRDDLVDTQARIQAERGGTLTLMLIAAGAALLAWTATLHRYESWYRQYHDSRRCSFLLGVPR